MTFYLPHHICFQGTAKNPRTKKSFHALLDKGIPFCFVDTLTSKIVSSDKLQIGDEVQVGSEYIYKKQ